MKRKSPMTLNMDKPDFVNDDGVKWWLLDVGEAIDGNAFRVETTDHDDDAFVIVKDDKLIYRTTNLEQLIYQFDYYKLDRTLK